VYNRHVYAVSFYFFQQRISHNLVHICKL